MKSVPFSAFGGRVTFHVRHFSLEARARYQAWINAAKTIDEAFVTEYDDIVTNLATVLAITEDIEFSFTGDENPMLQEFKVFWTAYAKTPGEKGVKLALDWRKTTHVTITNTWWEAAEAASNPFRDPAQLPGSALTSEEQERVKNPEDPLPEAG